MLQSIYDRVDIDKSTLCNISLMKLPFIEVAVVYKEVDSFVLECVQHCLDINYPNYGILLLPDTDTSFPIEDSRIRVIPTGKVSIPVKRNAAIEHATQHARYLAYIDSDAYPRPNWLRNAVTYFDDESVIVVGGPHLTPPDESLDRRVSGCVFSQWIGYGPESKRLSEKTKTHRTKNLPACNFIVRLEFLKTHPFDETYQAGEDSKLCADILSAGKDVLFAQDVVVYHHRRRIFLPVMKQTYYYGLFKAPMLLSGELPSLSPLIPAAFFVFALATPVGIIVIPALRLPLLLCWSIYVVTVTASTLQKSRCLRLTGLCVLTMFLVHLSYGFGFVRGLSRAVRFKNRTSPLDVPPNS